MHLVLGHGSEKFEPASVAATVALIASALVASYVGKVKELATSCAELEHEVRVNKLLAPLSTQWGDDWKRGVEALRTSLQNVKPSIYGDATKERDALEGALARAEREAYRGNSDLVVVPKGEWVPPIKDISPFLPDMAKLVGRRISGVVFSLDGSYNHLDFTDHSCFIMPSANQFLRGKHYESLRAGMQDLSGSGRVVPDPDQLRMVSFDQHIEAKALNEQLRHLFITLWTKATGRDDYVKSEWNQLGDILSRLGVRT